MSIQYTYIHSVMITGENFLGGILPTFQIGRNATDPCGAAFPNFWVSFNKIFKKSRLNWSSKINAGDNSTITLNKLQSLVLGELREIYVSCCLHIVYLYSNYYFVLLPQMRTR